MWTVTSQLAIWLERILSGNLNHDKDVSEAKQNVKTATIGVKAPFRELWSSVQHLTNKTRRNPIKANILKSVQHEMRPNVLKWT
jgi:hypothetical protein